MTVAGGMVCSDGILVYADTEWTASTMKIQRGKHWALGGLANVQCVLAGAGDEDNLRLAIQRFWQEMLQIKDPNKITTHDIHDSLEKALQFVYTNHVWPDPNAADKDFGIIMGMATDKEKPLLLKTAGTGIILSDSYEYVYLGSGTEMAMYLSSRLDVRGVSTDVGELMAGFILWEVKRHIQTCGGETVVYRVKQGDLKYRGEGDIRDMEDYFAGIDRKVQRIRVRTANLEQTDEEFDEKLKEFCDDLGAWRKVRLEKRKGQKDFTA